MSFDLVVYIAPPISEVIDQWQEQLSRLGQQNAFDPEAMSDIRQNGTFSGFFPVGTAGGFELYVHTASKAEINETDAPPQLVKTRYAITLMMNEEDLRIGYLCAAALATATDGAIFDPQSGDFLTTDQAIAEADNIMRN